MNPNPSLAVTFFVLVLTLVHNNNTKVVHASSVSSLFLNFRKLATHGYSKVSSSAGHVRKLTQSSSASPAPAPAPAPGPNGGGSVDENRCGNGCQDQNLTACLQISTADPKEAFLFVKNDGEGSRKVNVTVPHSNITFSVILPQHEAKKINVSAVVGASLSIVVNAGNGDCVIYMRSSVFKKLSIFSTQGTLVYGACLLFLTVLIVGVTLACCCKSRKSRLQSNGVAYQELEMGKPETISAEDLEKQEDWEDGWDDEWDESKAVKSPVAHRLGNVSANGLNSRSNDKHKWEKNWTD
ncbi:uncharacterized protein LOC116129748 [Pistacia vera]|uniref:uncharacterized protein LOC116129748 n=1 Tax=Pistacia vera TaxID=55513 RepID=UPI0012639B08|nr:uncharacterized protein LOC116129748 [Pistacia vera]